MEQISNDNLEQKFRQSELELGLTMENFKGKFVYCQQQLSNEDVYLLPRYHPCPSQLAYFSCQDIDMILAYGSQLIFQSGILLKVPVSTTIVAQCIFHYFYSRRSLIQFDIRDISMGTMFLACKSQETLRKSYQIAAVFDQIFKIQQGNRRPVRPLQPNSTQYNFIKNKIIKAQTDILFQLGFQIYRLFDVPHRYLSGLLSTFDKHPKSQLISCKAWGYLNDSYRTRVCLYYPGQIIAAASVYLSLKSQQIPFPIVSWWCLMQANQEDILNIISQLLNLYRNENRINLENIANIIKQIADIKHGFVNVFPVPYYRKIMLQNRNKIKIKINERNQDINIIDKNISKQPIQKNSKQPKDENEKKNHKRNKKKKDKSKEISPKEKSKKKHKKKHHKNQSRSRSRSHQSQRKKIQNSNKQSKLNEQMIPQKQQKQPENANKIKGFEIDKSFLMSNISSQLSKHKFKMKIHHQKDDDQDQQLLAQLKLKVIQRKKKELTQQE